MLKIKKITSFIMMLALSSTVMCPTAFAETQITSENLVDGNEDAYSESRQIVEATEEGLIAHWEFNEGSGTVAKDSSGNGVDGEIKGAEYEKDGEHTVLRFKASEKNYIDLGDKLGKALEGKGAVTIAAWVKADGPPVDTSYMVRSVMRNGTNTGNAAGMEYYINNTLQFRVTGRSIGTDGFQNKAYLFKDYNQWHHMVGIWDYQKKEIRAYIDGVEVPPSGSTPSAAFGSNVYTRGPVPPGSNNMDVIGGNGEKNNFNGWMDDVRVYSKVLTADEIEAVMAKRNIETVPSIEEINAMVNNRMEGAAALFVGKNDAFVNKHRIKLDWNDLEVKPIIVDGSVLIPLSFISEGLGAEVAWEEATGTITVKEGENTIIMNSGSTRVLLNGIEKELAVPPQIMNNHMMIPAKDVSELLSKKVYQDPSGLMIISNDAFNADSDKYVIERLIDLFTMDKYKPIVRDHRKDRSEYAYSDPSTYIYLGSTSIIRLDANTLIATWDTFGPKNDFTTRVMRSTDEGKTWVKISEIKNSTWSTVFTLNGNLYVMGPNRVFGGLAIYKSTDQGLTWTEAVDSKTGLIAPGNPDTREPNGFHSAPTSVLVANGRIYRAVENVPVPGGSVANYNAVVFSAPIDSDLLDASNWTRSNEIKFDATKVPAEWNLTGGGWLEGGIVQGKDGQIYNILRYDGAGVFNTAAMCKVSADGSKLEFDRMIHMPGGQTKFTIRYDENSEKYYSLVNYVTDPAFPRMRNVLSLAYSEDLVDWKIAETVLADNSLLGWDSSVTDVGYQYVDWVIDGDDILMAVREASDGARSYHDTNRSVFYRMRDFRKFVDPKPKVVLSGESFVRQGEEMVLNVALQNVAQSVYGGVYSQSITVDFDGNVFELTAINPLRQGTVISDVYSDRSGNINLKIMPVGENVIKTDSEMFELVFKAKTATQGSVINVSKYTVEDGLGNKIELVPQNKTIRVDETMIPEPTPKPDIDDPSDTPQPPSKPVEEEKNTDKDKEAGKDITIEVLPENKTDGHSVPEISSTSRNESFTGVSPYYSIEINPTSGDTLKSAELSYDVSRIKDKKRVGVYFYNAGLKEWEYIGGKAGKEEGKIIFNVRGSGTYIVAEYNKTFTDIKGHWAEKDIEDMASWHIIKGVNEDNYLPEGNITRAEFTVLLVRSLGLDTTEYDGMFNDVSKDNWYANPVQAAVVHGLIKGFEGKFRPEDGISREEMAVLMIRAYESAGGKVKEGEISPVFSDESEISTWAQDAVMKASSLGIVKGTGGGNFAPGENTTRAQAAVVLSRIASVLGR